MSRKAWRRTIPAILLGGHVGAVVCSAAWGALDPFEPFGMLLLGANVVLAAILLAGRGDLLIGAGVMFLLGVHGFAGHRIAPDALTSGAILMVNVLVFYVGMHVNRHLPARYWYAFVASFFALYAIFILTLENAQALFLLFLMLLAGCARSFRLLAYFWALTLSFTWFQPFAWESLLITFFVLTALFGARGPARTHLARLFLAIGMVLTALVFLPILVAVMGESLANIQPVLEDGRVRSAIAVTFLTATVSTVILLLFVVPLAYGISRLRFFGRTALLSLIDLPVVIPQSVAGIALVSVLGRNQYLGELIFRLTGVAVDNTILGIIVAQVVVSLPFIAKASIAAFDAVPEELETVARTLKASSFAAFRRVALPLASRGIFFGAVLAWARAAGEFGAVVILAPTPVTAPVEAFNRFVSVGAIEAAPLVTVLLAFSFVMFFLLQWSVRLLPAGAAGGGR